MHPFFENLVVTSTLGPHASLMDVHHNTSFRSILEDDSISSTSRARICFCLGKKARLWLIVKHSYDILGAGMLWKPKEARKFVKIS